MGHPSYCKSYLCANCFIDEESATLHVHPDLGPEFLSSVLEFKVVAEVIKKQM